jgi:hypothetical protein
MALGKAKVRRKRLRIKHKRQRHQRPLKSAW